MAEKTTVVSLRVPLSLYEDIKKASETNFRSVTQEIFFRLDRDKKTQDEKKDK